MVNITYRVEGNMDSKTIRYNNTRILVDQVGGVSNFASKINKGQSQASQFAGTTPIKGIGNKVAREIEDAFGKPHGWLDVPHESETNPYNTNNLNQKYVDLSPSIPVISWVQAGSWTTSESVPYGGEFKEWLPPNPKCGKNGYGLIVVGESMLPDFRPNDRIYINPNFQVNDLKTGDLVIVAFDGETEATFKKLIVECNGMYLEPLNPKWHEKMMELKDGCKLIGKVVGLYREV